MQRHDAAGHRRRRRRRCSSRRLTGSSRSTWSSSPTRSASGVFERTIASEHEHEHYRAALDDWARPSSAPKRSSTPIANPSVFQLLRLDSGDELGANRRSALTALQLPKVARVIADADGGAGRHRTARARSPRRASATVRTWMHPAVMLIADRLAASGLGRRGRAGARPGRVPGLRARAAFDRC